MSLRRRGFLLAGASAALALPTHAAVSQPKVDVLATLRPGASLQGLDLGSDGTVYVTVNADDVLARIGPDGSVSEVAHLPIHPHGVLVRKDGFIVAGQANRFSTDPNVPASARFSSLDGRVLVLDRAGKVIRSIAIGAATFPNGIAALPDGTILVADSVANVIWRVDARSGRVAEWSKDPFVHAEPSFPGANGIKVANGWVYVSNTIKQQVGRVRLGLDLKPTGGFTVLGTVPRVDEIAVAGDNTVYAATHGAMMCIPPDGPPQPAFSAVEGGSALRLAPDGRSIYVTTDGTSPDGTKTDVHVLRIWLGNP